MGADIVKDWNAGNHPYRPRSHWYIAGNESNKVWNDSHRPEAICTSPGIIFI